MLISTVGHKSILVRVAFAVVYLLLLLSVAIVLYPFVLMVGCSVTTIEYDRFYPVPVFLWDDSVLVGKFLHEKYEGPSSTIGNLSAKYAVPINSTSDLKTAMLDGDLLRDIYTGMDPGDPGWLRAARKRVADWHEFKTSLPSELCGVYFCNESPASFSPVRSGFIEFLRDRYAQRIRRAYSGRVADFNAERGFRLSSFDRIEKNDRVLAEEIRREYHIYLPRLDKLHIPQEELERRDWWPEDSPRMTDWLDYKTTLPPEHLQAICLSKLYQDFLSRKYSPEIFNSLYHCRAESFREVVFRAERLVSSGEVSDWREFVKNAEELSTVQLVVNPTVQLLYEHALEKRYETIGKYNAEFSARNKAFFEVSPSRRQPQDPRAATVWLWFIQTYVPAHFAVPIPDQEYHLEFLRSAYIAELKREYLTIVSLNEKKGTDFRTFEDAFDRKEAGQLLVKNLVAEYGSLDTYNRLNRSTYNAWESVVLPNPLRTTWRNFLSRKYEEIALLNAAHRREYVSFDEIPFPAVLPDHDLVQFVKTSLPLRLIAIEDSAQTRRLWHNHLNTTFGGSVEKLASAAGQPYVAFEQVPFYFALPFDRNIRPYWIQFIEQSLPFEAIRILDPEENFRTYLREKYGSLAAVNNRYGAKYASFEGIRPPYKEADLLEFDDEKSALRIGFLFRNLLAVGRAVFVESRSLLNTVALCLLSLVGALTVNPLAAYALGRFPSRLGRRLGFFFLFASVFPATVIIIPNYLLLRKLGLLNTYWAVILPTLASGLSILLLKRFFDRIPSEFYSMAALDGASELRTFVHVCLPLSKPILAVTALQAVVFTYGRFLWPFLTCQKEQMWTVMVWLYQFHSEHSTARPELAMAALVVTSLPLVLVLLMCQRTLERTVRFPGIP